jgi:hypothetical protein
MKGSFRSCLLLVSLYRLVSLGNPSCLHLLLVDGSTPTSQCKSWFYINSWRFQPKHFHILVHHLWYLLYIQTRNRDHAIDHFKLEHTNQRRHHACLVLELEESYKTKVLTRRQWMNQCGLDLDFKAKSYGCRMYSHWLFWRKLRNCSSMKVRKDPFRSIGHHFEEDRQFEPKSPMSMHSHNLIVDSPSHLVNRQFRLASTTRLAKTQDLAIVHTVHRHLSLGWNGRK